LELQLEQAEKLAVAPEVKDAVTAALRYIRSGKGGRIRGGQALIKRLEVARTRAAEEPEWHVVRLLQDSIDYATGRILKYAFEESYRLFEDAGRRESTRNFVATILSGMTGFVKDAGNQVLSDNSEVTATELLDQLLSLAADVPFLEAPAERPGRYRIVRGQAEMALWLERVLRNRIDVEDPHEMAKRLVVSPEALKVLVNDEDGRTLMKAAELKRRAVSLAALRRVAEDPSALEIDLQRALQDQAWIFGGQFIGAEARRRLVPGDEMDIPLIRGDGSLHLVELKLSMGIAGIVKYHRGAWVPTSKVHDAVAQAANYLIGLDENRKVILDEFGIETRRASALILIGHPGKHPDLPESQINEVLRSLNAHLSRIEVLTYKDLLDNAERSLAFL
jgi:hypothetical protein